MSSVIQRQGDLVGIGEAMLEMAPVGDGLYALGFAGDTLNTVWYLKRLLGRRDRVGYVTRVGEDSLSEQFLNFLREAGIDATRISRDAERTLGLYLIRLEGVERRFSYWRAQSAARRLADDPDGLAKTLRGAASIHVSGITLAVVETKGRRHLFAELAKARATGTLVSFDPNVRRRLWPDEAEMCAAMREMFALCDIALPSFDDEAGLWGDATPEATVERIAAISVEEIVVKNGAAPALVWAAGKLASVAAGEIPDVRDTTGAGDSFNAGYLAARRRHLSPPEACAFAHTLAAEVVRHPGALAPPNALTAIQQAFEALSERREAQMRSLPPPARTRR
jgi:2-dehydro-3-deoxygluconokinase